MAIFSMEANKGCVMAPLEPGSKEEEELEPGPTGQNGSVPMAHEEQPGDEDKVVTCPSEE